MSMAVAYLHGYDAAIKLVESRMRKLEADQEAGTEVGMVIRKVLEAVLADLNKARPA